MSVRSSAAGWLLRILLLTMGVASAILALWVFYFRPWLGGASRLDPWLDRHRCAIAALCTRDFTLGSQPGVLAALVAILFFGLALWRWPGGWVGDDPPAIPLALSSQSWLTRSLLLAFLVGLGAIVYQAYQALSGNTPEPLVWLVGMGAFLLTAILWDAAQPADLIRTLPDLTVAMGITLIVLGVACVMARRTVVGLLLGGVGGAFIVGSWWTVRPRSPVRSLEHIAVLALTLAALVMAMSRVWSWRFAFVGDEWGFFWTARAFLHQPDTFKLLGLRAPNDYHTVLSSAIQAWVMKLAGEDVFGWRLSSVLPFVLSVPPVYVLLRWLAGREAAFLGAGLFASSHMLLTFSMVAYNNTQALLPLTLGLGLFAFASQRTSVLRYILVGIALGLGLFVFGLARLAVIPVGLLLLTFAWPLRKRTLPGWVPAAAGGLAASAPMLFNLANWQTMLKATPIWGEVASRGVSVSAQMARNTVRGILAFLSGSSNTHFIAGPHTDPLTALLMLVGLGCVLAGLVRYKRAWVWLLGSGLFVVAVSAIQQYGFIANTRMFILLPVYAVFAGLGGAALARLLLPENAMARGALLGALVAAGAGLNLLHVERISLPNSNWPAETLIIQQLQATEALDRGGMPVFIVMETGRAQRENSIARAYDVGRERLIFLNPTEALVLSHLCLAGEQPAMVLVDARNSQVNALRRRIATCWFGHKESAVLNHVGEISLYRFLTVKGQQELARPLTQRHSERQKPDTLAVVNPGDIVVDSSGTVYVLSLTEARVYRFAPNGRPLGGFVLVQDDPLAMALTPEGLLLVASAGSGSRLVWYDDADGTVVRRAPPDLGIGVPRGLAVAANGEIFVADVSGARVVCLSPGGEIIGQLTGGGRIAWPSSVTTGRDDSIWVLNAAGDLLQVSPRDEVLTTLSVPTTSPEQPWRMLLASNGDLIMTEPDAQRVVRRDPQGHVVRVWSGFERPVGLGANAAGCLFVSDWSLDQVGILPPAIDGPKPVAAVVREDVAPVSEVLTEPTRPSASPALTRSLQKGRAPREGLPLLCLQAATDEHMFIISRIPRAERVPIHF